MSQYTRRMSTIKVALPQIEVVLIDTKQSLKKLLLEGRVQEGDRAIGPALHAAAAVGEAHPPAAGDEDSAPADLRIPEPGEQVHPARRIGEGLRAATARPLHALQCVALRAFHQAAQPEHPGGVPGLLRDRHQEPQERVQPQQGIPETGQRPGAEGQDHALRPGEEHSQDVQRQYPFYLTYRPLSEVLLGGVSQGGDRESAGDGQHAEGQGGREGHVLLPLEGGGGDGGERHEAEPERQGDRGGVRVLHEPRTPALPGRGLPSGDRQLLDGAAVPPDHDQRQANAAQLPQQPGEAAPGPRFPTSTLHRFSYSLQLQQYVLTLHLLSLLYQYTHQYSLAHESTHLALWILIKLLTDDYSQLFDTVFKRYQFLQESFKQLLLEELEIRTIVLSQFPITPQMDNLDEGLQEYDFDLNALNKKLYLKYSYLELNKSQFITCPDATCNDITTIYDNPTKKSFLDNDCSKKFLSTDLTEPQLTQETTTLKKSQSRLDSPRKRKRESCSSAKIQIRRVSTPQGEVKSKYHYPVLKKHNFTNQTKTVDLQNPTLNSVIKHLLVQNLDETGGQFCDYEALHENCEEMVGQERKAHFQLNRYKHTLNFKKHYTSTGKFEQQSHSYLMNYQKQQTNIRNQYNLFNEVHYQDEKIKELKKIQKSAVQQKEKKEQQKKEEKQVAFKNLMLKHGKLFGLKKTKKLMMQAEEDQKDQKQPSKINLGLLFKKKEAPKKSEEELQKEVHEINRNVYQLSIQSPYQVIKLVMQENQNERMQTEHQMKQKKYYYHKKKDDQEKHNKSTANLKIQTHLLTNYEDLATSTEYLTYRNDTSKKIGSFSELVTMKKKLSILEKRKKSMRTINE